MGKDEETDLQVNAYWAKPLTCHTLYVLSLLKSASAANGSVREFKNEQCSG